MKQEKQSKRKSAFEVIDRFKIGDQVIVIGKNKYQLAVGYVDKKEVVRWKRYFSR